MSKRNFGQQAAAALKYNPDMSYAPVVVASGLGELAKKIINIADENGVPVYRDDSTAALLSMLDSLRRAMELLEANVGGKHICGMLTVTLNQH